MGSLYNPLVFGVDGIIHVHQLRIQFLLRGIWLIGQVRVISPSAMVKPIVASAANLGFDSRMIDII